MFAFFQDVQMIVVKASGKIQNFHNNRPESCEMLATTIEFVRQKQTTKLLTFSKEAKLEFKIILLFWVLFRSFK